MAPKERNFFNYNVRQRGLNWYLQHFEHEGDEEVQVRGEISPNYAVMRRREIRLAKDLFPHLSIILIVRHPVDRMWSALRRHWTYSYLDDVEGVGKDVSSMIGHADQRLNDAFGDYQAIYRNWSSVFDEEDILLLRFDQVQTAPDRTVAHILDFIGAAPDLQWIRSYRENTSIRNQSKADIEMPAYVRYYLSCRYLERTRIFNAMTGGLVQDWVDDMEQCVTNGTCWWDIRYRVRSVARYYSMRWTHRLLDPLRTWWKVKRARQNLSKTRN